MTEESRETLSRLETALDDVVAQSASRLDTLADAGEEVLKLAADFDGTRRGLAETEGTWKQEMSDLAETMRHELERLRATSAQLAESTATAGARVTHVSSELTDIASAWRAEQHVLTQASERGREHLETRLAALDAQITGLDRALTGLETLTERAGPPIEGAAGAIAKAARDLGAAGKAANLATGLWAKEAEAARNTRLSVLSEAQADRAHWQTERGALRDQAEYLFAQIGDTSKRIDAFARDLSTSESGLPSRLDQLHADCERIAGQLAIFEEGGGKVAGGLSERLATLQGLLEDAQTAFADEANVIRSVTADLSQMHMTFDQERQAVSGQVASLSGTLERLDEQLRTIGQQVESPLDLTPVLGALRDEMGQAVTHLTRAVEDQTLSSQRSLSNAVYQLGQKIEGQSGTFEHLIATGLLDLSDRLNTKITAQHEAAETLAETLTKVQGTLTGLAGAERPAAEILPPTDVSAQLDPRIERLDDTAREMIFELRALARSVAEPRAVRVPEELEAQLGRIETLQGRLGEAQQAMALTVRDGLQGVLQRIRATGTPATQMQLDEVMETLARHQDRLSGIMRELSVDMRNRIDGLSGQIMRGGKLPPPRKGIFSRPAKADLPATETAVGRVAQTPVPESNDLTAIYAALQGLTDELKGLSQDTSDRPQDTLEQTDISQRDAS
jgi:chromosome segregation ATPase